MIHRRQLHKQTNRETRRQMGRQTEKKMDRSTDRQIDRQTDLLPSCCSSEIPMSCFLLKLHNKGLQLRILLHKQALKKIRLL